MAQKLPDIQQQNCLNDKISKQNDRRIRNSK